MLLAIDAGNTNIVFALYEKGLSKKDLATPLAQWRSHSDARRTAEDYAAFIGPMLALAGIDRGAILHVLVSSVVPDCNAPLRRFAAMMFGVDAQLVGEDLTDLGIVIDLPRFGQAGAGQMGADRLVNTVAVLHDYPAPALVIDFGTATTFDVINDRGHFCGGVIAPGANLSMAALHLAAAKLPKVGVAKPEAVIGQDTVSAMQSGVYWGYIGLIEGMVARITAELGQKPFVLATGGLAPLFAGDTDCFDKIDDDLTLRGLYYLYQRLGRADGSY